MKIFSMILLLILIGHLSVAQNFDLTSSEFKAGDVYIVNPKILFDLSKSTIRPESYRHLDSIADFLLKNDSLVVEIGIHTDSRGSDHYSVRLDQKRAESILKYMKERGVSSDRLVAKGYGETELIISNEEIDKMKTAQEKEEAHAVNRRTEFKIIEIRK